MASITSASVVLAIAMHPLHLPADAWTDVQLDLTFTNQSTASLDLYPRAARPWLRSGWGSPTYRLVVVATSGSEEVPFTELRTRHGPPGHPPNASYWEEDREHLTPGASHTIHLRACFIPAALLRPEQLDPRNLDPDGMDGLARLPTAGASVLVLGADCATLRPRAESPDLLRGTDLAFIPRPGEYRLSANYTQRAWMAFSPRHKLDIISGQLAFTVANPSVRRDAVGSKP